MVCMLYLPVTIVLIPAQPEKILRLNTVLSLINQFISFKKTFVT